MPIALHLGQVLEGFQNDGYLTKDKEKIMYQII